MEIYNKLKSRSVTPKIYSVVLESQDSAYLYCGVNFTLDEAIIAARRELKQVSGVEAVAMSKPSVWDMTPPEKILPAFFSKDVLRNSKIPVLRVAGSGKPQKTDETVDELIEAILTAKNKLMKKIIHDKQTTSVAVKAPGIFSEAEVALISNTIKK